MFDEVLELLRAQIQHFAPVNNVVELRREHIVERGDISQVILAHQVENQQAIVDAQRLLQELRAVLHDFTHDEVVGEPQQLLDVGDVYRYLARVHVHDERVEDVAVQATDGELLLDDLVLLQYRVEVAGVACEHIAVHLYRLAVDV